MLLSDAKRLLEQRLKGIRPIPDDSMLDMLFFEAIVYVATRTTPRVLTKDIGVEAEDYTVLRVIEDNMFIVMPDKPIFDISNENYSATAILHIDEELCFAVVYYVAYLILTGSEANTRGSTARADFLKQANDYISMFDSNYSRAGRETYGLL